MWKERKHNELRMENEHYAAQEEILALWEQAIAKCDLRLVLAYDQQQQARQDQHFRLRLSENSQPS